MTIFDEVNARARKMLTAFLGGLSASTAVYVPTRFHGEGRPYPHASAVEAMRGDWIRVGKEIEAAMTADHDHRRRAELAFQITARLDAWNDGAGPPVEAPDKVADSLRQEFEQAQADALGRLPVERLEAMLALDDEALSRAVLDVLEKSGRWRR